MSLKKAEIITSKAVKHIQLSCWCSIKAFAGGIYFEGSGTSVPLSKNNNTSSDTLVCVHSYSLRSF